MPEDAARAVSAARGRRARPAARSRTTTRTGHIYELRRRWSGSGPPSTRRARLEFPSRLTARAEGLIRGNPDLDDTIARLQAYEAAGADVLYAPGLRNAEQVRAVCSAVGKPVNVLAHRGLSMAEIVDAGGRRVSVGGALGWVAARALVAAARQVADGDFSALTGPGEIRDWLD